MMMEEAKLIDISWPLSERSVSYKDRNPLVIERVRDVVQDGVSDSLCHRFHMHAGTHVDAPSHFMAGGATIDQLPLEQMNGSCRILDLTHIVGSKVCREHLLSFQIQPGQRLLLKTKNSLQPADGAYFQGEVSVAACAARYLAECKVALVGVDALGLEQNQPGHPSHKALFEAGIIVVEGLRLGEVEDTSCSYHLHLLPLAFVGTEAAPARAVLSRA